MYSASRLAPDSGRAAGNRALRLLALAACSVAMLIVPASAGAVVPNVTLDAMPTYTNAGSLSINGYGNAVAFTATCQISNNGGNSGVASCGYMNYWISIGMSLVGSDGPRTLTVVATATDGTGNQKLITHNFTLDRTAPNTILSGGPYNSQTISGTESTHSFYSNESGTFECQIDGGGYSACTSPKTFTGLADGPHTFQVRAIDLAGNYDSTPYTADFNVNNAPPAASIVYTPDGGPWSSGVTDHVNTTSPTWQVTATRPDALMECRVDAGSWVDCTGGTYNTTLAEGAHTFEVRAYLAGPTSVQDPPVANEVVVDVTQPIPSFANTSGKAVGGSSAAFSYSANEPVDRFTCRLDNNVMYDPCPTEFTSLSGALHTLELWAYDLAGNSNDEAVVWTWTNYIAPPETTISGAPDPTAPVEIATFSFNSSAPGTFECSIDGGAFSTCSSPLSISGLSTGEHTLSVRAVDPAGQSDGTPATAKFNQLNRPPAISQVSLKRKSLTFTVSEDATVKVKIAKCKGKGRRLKCKKTVKSATARPGKFKPARIRIKRGLISGSYRVTLTATDSGGASTTFVKTLKVK